MGSMHYLGISVRYIEATGGVKGSVKEQLISISPLTASGDDGDDDDHSPIMEDIIQESETLDAGVHAAHIRNVLSIYYGKEPKQDYVCVMGDNTNLNPAVTSDLGIPFVGCGNHRLNLEMKKLCREQPMIQRVINTLHKIMTTTKAKHAFAVRLCNIYEKLGEPNKTPKLMIETRWTGAFVMVEYFMKESKHLRDIGVDPSLFPYEDDPHESDDESVHDETETKCTEAEVEQVYLLFIKLHLLTITMQADSLSLADSRDQMKAAKDHIVATCADPRNKLEPYVCKYLDPNADIVRCNEFEDAVAILQSGKNTSLSQAQKNSLRWCKIRAEPIPAAAAAAVAAAQPTADSNSDVSEDEDVVPFLEDSPHTKRRKLVKEQKEKAMNELKATHRSLEMERRGPDHAKYHDLAFISATNASMERVFSLASNVLTNKRRGMTPYVFEMFMLLKANMDLWDAATVKTAILNHRRTLREQRDEEANCVMAQSQDLSDVDSE